MQLVCMACWIDPNLKENFRQFWNHTDEVYDDIMIDWNSNYQAMKRVYSEHTGGKYEVIQCVEKQLDELQPILIILERTLSEFLTGAIAEQPLIEVIQKYAGHARDIYSRGTECPLAPPECEDFRQEFSSAIAFFDNLFLFYSPDDLQKRTVEERTRLFHRQLSYLKEALRNLDYERKKL